MLYTSLEEIYSFKPCWKGWETILKAQNKTAPDCEPISLLDCVESNSLVDVCWLLKKRKIEIAICVRLARLCADSVAHLENAYAMDAMDAAANAATDAMDAAAAAYAAYAATAYATAYAATMDAMDAMDAQQKLNKQFLIQAVNEYQNGELQFIEESH
jgi:hypothetical protein